MKKDARQEKSNNWWPKIGGDLNAFRQLMDELPIRTFVFNRKGELLYANQIFVETLRCRFDQIQKMMDRIIEKDSKLFTRVVGHVIYKHEEFIVPKFILTHMETGKRRQTFHIRFRPLTLLLDDAVETVMIGTAVDITDETIAQEMVVQHTQEIELLHQAGQQLSETLDLKKIYHTFFDLVSGIMPHQNLFVSSYKPEEDLIYCEFAIVDGAEVDVGLLPPVPLEPEGKGLQSQAIRSGKPLLINDVQEQVKTASQAHYIDGANTVYEAGEMPEDEMMIRAALIVPVMLAGKAVGAIQVFSYEADAFSDKDLRLLEAMASQIAVASNNALLYQKAQTELAEREKLQAALEEERNLLAQRVEERTAELRAANLELQEALQIKDEFLANMSHELRTPLNAILGMRESFALGTYGPVDPRQEKPLNHIQKSGEHLLALINDMLDLTKVQAGHIVATPEPFQLSLLARECVNVAAGMARQKGISIQFDPGECEWNMNADERQIKQVVLNLLSNAIKFTDVGGTIGIDIHSATDTDRVCLAVWDTGIGISAEDRKKIFKPFVQLDSGLNRKYSGTGLGLALSAQLVKLNGGLLDVESDGVPGEGSRFSINLPGDCVPFEEKSLEAADSDKEPVFNTGAKRRILVAEDNPSNRETVAAFLKQAGHEVLSVHDGAKAVELARSARPDLIIMDIQMPVLDGLTAIRQIRQEAALAEVPIIALTALVMPGDKERCLAAGADLYLSKPVRLRSLVETVGEMLK
jgi:signal transduction histidine kinase